MAIEMLSGHKWSCLGLNWQSLLKNRKQKREFSPQAFASPSSSKHVCQQSGELFLLATVLEKILAARERLHRAINSQILLQNERSVDQYNQRVTFERGKDRMPSFTDNSAFKKGQKVLLLGTPDDSQAEIKTLLETLKFEVILARSSLDAITSKPFTTCRWVLVDADLLSESVETAVNRLAEHIHCQPEHHTEIVTFSQFDQIDKLANAGAHYSFPKPVTAEIITALMTETLDSPTKVIPTVLLVEDNLIQQQIMAHYIDEAGAIPTTVSTRAPRGARNRVG